MSSDLLWQEQNPKNLFIRVIIFKSPSEEVENIADDPYLKKLRQLPLTAIMVPTLQFNYKNLNILAQDLDQPDLFSGLIFASPRCVRATYNSLSKLSNNCELKTAWKLLKTFVVGETTGRLVSNELKLCYEGASSGKFMSLIPVILNYNFEKPLLMPCGNLHSKASETALLNKGIRIKCIEAYETCPHIDLQKTLQEVFSSNIAYHRQCLIFFSPSAVQAVLPYLPRSDFSFVAIGPTTASALTQENISVAGICAKPTENDLVQTLTSVLKLDC